MIWSQDSQRSSNSVCTSWVLIWIFNKTDKYFNETTDEASLEKGQRHVLTSGQGWFYNTSPVGNHFPLPFWVGRLCSHWFHNQRSLMAGLLLGFVRLPEFWPGSQRQPILSLRARSTLPRHRWFLGQTKLSWELNCPTISGEHENKKGKPSRCPEKQVHIVLVPGMPSFIWFMKHLMQVAQTFWVWPVCFDAEQLSI